MKLLRTLFILTVSVLISSSAMTKEIPAPLKVGQVIGVVSVCDLKGHNEMVRVWKEDQSKIGEQFAKMVKSGNCAVMPVPIQARILEIKFEGLNRRTGLWRLKLAEDAYSAVVDEVNEI